MQLRLAGERRVTRGEIDRSGAGRDGVRADHGSRVVARRTRVSSGAPGFARRHERPTPAAMLATVVTLRPVVASDVAVFYEHQADPDAARVAAFPSRDRAAHAAHWKRTLADDRTVLRTIEHEQQTVGYVGAWQAADGDWYVGYWIGRAFWGRGHATAGLAELLRVVTARPLNALVATDNVGSVRVLERCGFRRVCATTAYDERIGADVTEARYVLAR
jgi:RimJ/RimL family protein N-acetyltransferase